VPFQFSIGNKTFAAGDYQMTYQKTIGDKSEKIFVIEAVEHEPYPSVRFRVHLGRPHPFRTLTKTTYDFQISNQETQLANASPRMPVTIVSVTPNKNSEVFSNRTGHLQ